MTLDLKAMRLEAEAGLLNPEGTIGRKRSAQIIELITALEIAHQRYVEDMLAMEEKKYQRRVVAVAEARVLALEDAALLMAKRALVKTQTASDDIRALGQVPSGCVVVSLDTLNIFRESVEAMGIHAMRGRTFHASLGEEPNESATQGFTRLEGEAVKLLAAFASLDLRKDG